MFKPKSRWSSTRNWLDHDAILDLWQSGLTASQIESKLGITEGSISNVINRARDRGDKRAVSRRGVTTYARQQAEIDRLRAALREIAEGSFEYDERAQFKRIARAALAEGGMNERS